jgi:hypothetical protein
MRSAEKKIGPGDVAFTAGEIVITLAAQQTSWWQHRRVETSSVACDCVNFVTTIGLYAFNSSVAIRETLPVMIDS